MIQDLSAVPVYNIYGDREESQTIQDHRQAQEEAQREQIQMLKEKLEELARRSEENRPELTKPVPLLAPDATDDEIIEVVNRIAYYINARISSGS